MFGVGCIVALTLGTWLWGGLSGALFGDGWPRAPLADHLGVALRLREDLGDPAAAWGEPDREALPGPMAFYTALGLLMAGASLVGVAVAVAAGRLHRLRLGSRRDGSSRWARRGDLRRLRVPRAQPRRLTLGHVGGALIAAEERQSVIVVAPTQSGKTTGLAIPAILEWEGPVLATSVKTDLVRHTLAHRRALGEARVYDPAAVTGLSRSGWTPLASCGDWQGARRSAERLVRSAQPAGEGGEAEFWAAAARRYLAPLMFAAERSGRTMSDVARWIDEEEVLQVESGLGGRGDELVEDDDAECRAALQSLRSIWSSDDRLRSSLAATAAAAVDAYLDPTVAESALDRAISARWLLSKPANALYLCATADEQRRLRPLFVTLISEVISGVYAKAAHTGRPIDPPLLLVLDEAANVAPLPDLAALASTGAGQGIQLLTVVQDLAQVHERWGRQAETIVNNHRAKLIGGGISCNRTLGYVRALLGEEELRQVSVSSTTGEQRRRSQTESSSWRPLAPSPIVRQAPLGSAVLVYGDLPPARIRLRPRFGDRRLRGTQRPRRARRRGRR